MNQNPFPTCTPPPNNYLGTASYTATCVNGGEFKNGLGWVKTGSIITRTVNGLVLMRRTTTAWVFMVAHDRDSSPKLSIVTISNSGEVSGVSDVAWAGAPFDIEAVFSYAGLYYAVASGQKRVYQLSLSSDESSVTPLASISFGSQIDNGECEAAFIHPINGTQILIVASRGGDATPSKIAWAEITISPFATVGAFSSTTFSCPYPTLPNVRHISDLRTDHAGNLFVTSASDPGDSGPFSGAVYHVGAFIVSGSGITLAKLSTPREIYRDANHGIEAICSTPNDSHGLIIGSDDELLGGFAFIQGTRDLGIPVGDPFTATRQATSLVSLIDAENRARQAAMDAANKAISCRYVARECVTPVCTVSGQQVQYPPICCYGHGATNALAIEDAMTQAAYWAGLYCQ